MKVMSRAFHRDSDGIFRVRLSTSSKFPKSPFSYVEPMNLDWLDDLEIPANAKMLWFELLDTPTKHSIPVKIDVCDNEIYIQGKLHDTSLYYDEFARNGFERIVKFLDLEEELEMHVQVYYRT